MFCARSPVSIKDFSRKQWDPFLNYRSWNLGTEFIRKPNEPPLESVNAKPAAVSCRLSTAGYDSNCDQF